MMIQQVKLEKVGDFPKGAITNQFAALIFRMLLVVIDSSKILIVQVIRSTGDISQPISWLKTVVLMGWHLRLSVSPDGQAALSWLNGLRFRDNRVEACSLPRQQPVSERHISKILAEIMVLRQGMQDMFVTSVRYEQAEVRRWEQGNYKRFCEKHCSLQT